MWNPFPAVFIFHVARTLWRLFLQCMWLAPCIILHLLFSHYMRLTSSGILFTFYVAGPLRNLVFAVFILHLAHLLWNFLALCLMHVASTLENRLLLFLHWMWLTFCWRNLHCKRIRGAIKANVYPKISFNYSTLMQLFSQILWTLKIYCIIKSFLHLLLANDQKPVNCYWNFAFFWQYLVFLAKMWNSKGAANNFINIAMGYENI